MRELKFRAWDSERKVMITEFEEYQVSMDYGELKVCFGGAISDYRELEVMQSTGLKDKNGKEIYEGDICRATEPSLRNIVEDDGKNELNLLGEIKISVKGIQFGYGYACDFLNLEIIGNRYENPELLSV